MTHVTQYVLTHGALVLFAWILAQQVGAPIPSVPLLLVVGSLASSGRINVASVLGASLGACLAADGFWYHVGRAGWSISNYVRPRTEGWATRALCIINRNAAGALLPAKFISCSNLVALVAGKTGIALERFLVFDSIASFLWAGGYIAIGYFIGNRVEVAVRYASAPLLVLLGLLLVWFLLKLVRHARWPRLHAVLPAILTLLACCATPARAQYSVGAAGATSYATTPSSSLGQGPLIGSVPTGATTEEVLHLTLREAIDRALKYNLGSIEGGENTCLARGQRLIALSQLLPQIGAGVSENVEQVSASTLEIETPLIPQIIRPYAYSTVELNASQMLFSYESIQRFRAARTAGAAVHNGEAGVQAAAQNLNSARAALSQAEANAKKTDADLVHYSQLVAKEDVSRQQYDQALAAAKANRAAVVSSTATVQAYEQAFHQSEGKLLQAKADLRNAQTAPQQVSVARAKADSANAQVYQRKAQLDQADLNLSYTVIRSPVTGIIGKKNAEVGQNVGIGQELVDVVPLDDVWVTANFKETQLEHMRPGQSVEIKVDAYGRTWKAHITNLGGGTGSVFSLLPPENATGN